jgi:hypothetical protein
MQDSDRDNQVMLPAPAEPSTSTVGGRTRELRVTSWTLLDLVSVWFVAATTIIFFGIASLSFLHFSKEIPRVSDIRDRGVAVKLERFNVFPHIHSNAAPAALVPAMTTLPSSVAKAIPRTSTTRGPATGNARPPESSGARPVSAPLPPGASEASGARHNSEPFLLGINEEAATPDESQGGALPTPAVPTQQRDQPFHEFETHHNQNVGLDGNNAVLREKTAVQSMPKSQSHNAAFWRYRLRKECGPIRDPALSADCVRSFSAQYPGTLNASPTVRRFY